jgi:hypothetical protein
MVSPVGTLGEVAFGHRLALYELSRPIVLESFEGRRDFG